MVILVILKYRIWVHDSIAKFIRMLFSKFLKENFFCICATFYKLLISKYVTGFGKTDHIVTIDISRNTDLKHRSHHGSLVLDCSHARFAV